MTTTLSDLELRLSSLIMSYNALGLNLEEIEEDFKAHSAAYAYIRRHKNQNANDKIKERQDIINMTKENYKRYKQILNIRNKIKKKRSGDESLWQLNISPRSQQQEGNIFESGTECIQENSNRRRERHYNNEDNNIEQIERNEETVNNRREGQNSNEGNNSEQVERAEQNIDSDTTTADDVPQNNQCENCKRRQNILSHESYRLQFFNVNSANIRKRGDFKLLRTYSGERACNYTVCKECKTYLEDKDNHSKNVWPWLFLLLLTG